MKKIILIVSLLLIGLNFTACHKNRQDSVNVIIDTITPKEIVLNKNEITLKLETTQELKYSVIPSEADQTTTIEVENTEIINYKNNIITPRVVGKTKITFTTANMITTSCIVKVIDKYDHKPNEVKLSSNKLSIELGSTEELTYDILPSDADQSIQITNSNPNVAIIKDGIVSPKILGETNITFTSINGKTATCLVQVKNKSPKSINFTQTEITIPKGEPTKISYTIKPIDALAELTFSSSDNEVLAIYNNEELIGIKGGTAILTVKTQNGLQATCKVTVDDSRQIKDGDIVFTGTTETASFELEVSNSIDIFVNNKAKTIDQSQKIQLRKDEELVIPMDVKKDILSISCSDCYITGDFTKFTTLNKFSADNITNTELEVLGTEALTSLRINKSNKLASLKCNQCNELTSIHISASAVGNVDISNLKKLSSIQYVGCINMTELIIPNKEILKTLNITSSNIKQLNLSGTENLVRCELEKTPIEIIDLTNSQAFRIRGGSEHLKTVKLNTGTFKKKYIYLYIGKQEKAADRKYYRDLSVNSNDFKFEYLIGKEPADGQFSDLTNEEKIGIKALQKFTNKGKGYVQFVDNGAKWFYEMTTVKATSKWGYDTYTYKWVKD